MSVVGLVLGIIAVVWVFVGQFLCLGWLALVFAVPGLIFSVVGLAQSISTGQAKGVAIVGLVTSVLAAALYVLSWVLLAGSIGGLGAAFSNAGNFTGLPGNVAPAPAGTPSAAGPNTKVLCNFDGDDPLGSPLFPKAHWQGDAPQSGGISTCEVDSTQGALGSPKSMRWNYQVKNGQWVQAALNMGFDQRKKAASPVDFTMYDSISFYMKSLKPDGYGFVVNAKPVQEGDEHWVTLPAGTSSTDWRKVTISLRDAGLSKLDLKEAWSLCVGHLGQGDDGNVVWIDEMTLTCR
jgi:hypothetical protein